MKLPDHLIISYLEVYTDVPLEQIAEISKQVMHEPMKCKLFLAHEIVKRYHGAEVADQEQQWFMDTFSSRHVPEDIPAVTVAEGEYTAFALVKRFFGEQKSNRQVRYLFEQGAISLNEDTINMQDQVVEAHDGDVWRVGKRAWFRVHVNE